jgi:hypothetical protein
MSLETHLIHSLAYHLQMDGQTEQVNKILEDMLRASVMENQGSWDKHLPLNPTPLSSITTRST